MFSQVHCFADGWDKKQSVQENEISSILHSLKAGHSTLPNYKPTEIDEATMLKTMFDWNNLEELFIWHFTVILIASIWSIH